MASKVLICGDRNWHKYLSIAARIDELPEEVVIITGGARGADYMASVAALAAKRDLIVIHAKWDKHGRSAGPIRNREMLDLKPKLVIAFHAHLDASKGTKDCVTEAKKRGIKVEVHKK